MFSSMRFIIVYLHVTTSQNVVENNFYHLKKVLCASDQVFQYVSSVLFWNNYFDFCH